MPGENAKLKNPRFRIGCLCVGGIVLIFFALAVVRSPRLMFVVKTLAGNALGIVAPGPDVDVRELKVIIEEKGMDFPPPDVHIKVHKSIRVLELYSGDTLLKDYRIALGFNPDGDKQIEGDGRTPEGDYYICTRNQKSSFHLFLGLSYPNKADAERGLQANRIDDAEYEHIAQAVEGKRQPPWNTRLGGAVGIHGNGSKRDWTAGCIALENKDVEELWAVTRLGDKVEIFP